LFLMPSHRERRQALIGAGAETFPAGAALTVNHAGQVTLTATATPASPQFSEPPAIAADIRTPAQTLSLTVDVGPDPALAAAILGSVRPAPNGARPTSTTTPTANGEFETYLYVSADRGRTWTRQRRLENESE
jgi:hypothetical protein